MRSYIIAEAGVNHNGSIDLARQLIDAASEAGADAVKFQTFRADALVTQHAPKAAYQQATTDEAKSQYAMLKALELDHEAHQELIAHCQKREIEFLSTAFDRQSLRMLVEEFKLPRLKIPSGEITNGPLILAAALTGLPLIVSTGMSTLGDIEQALGVVAFGYTAPADAQPGRDEFAAAYASEAGQQSLRDRVTVLHCTTEYPAPFEEVNLRAMDTLHHAFGLAVGYSDHTEGITVPVAAVARGATLIEKHFTLDRTLPGPDHKASLEPDELTEMVRSIRVVEQALGTSTKAPTASELKNRTVARKCLTAIRPINKGDRLTESNMQPMRPAEGISPLSYWDYLGQEVSQAYEPGDAI